MKEIVQLIDGLPWIIRVILALPIVDGIAYGIYRIAKGLDRKDNTMLFVGILWLFLGIPILWIIDLFQVVFTGKVTFFA
jgi:hypothetical protein